MTVQELIDHLKNVDPSLEVWSSVYDAGYYEIEPEEVQVQRICGMGCSSAKVVLHIGPHS